MAGTSDKTAPNSQLNLDWVYGYRGHQCRNNAKYNKLNQAVYFVAGVGITYNIKDRKQNFFLGHDDDILSLAIHPNKSLIATGQVGKEPYICIWDSFTNETVSLLKGSHTHGVSVVSFDTSGDKLLSVGLDPMQKFNIWDWKKGKVLATSNAHNDRVFDCQFTPNNSSKIVSCGVKHIKFWTMCGNALSFKKGIFGKVGEMQTMLCLAFGSSDSTFAGTLSGDVYIWEGNKLERAIVGLHAGAIYSIDACQDGYVTGGKDGCVVLSDTEFRTLTKINLNETDVGYKGLCIRSLCWVGEQLLIGTQDSDIIEINLNEKHKPISIMQGHAEGELWALAVHPKKPIFATGSDDQTIRLWHLSRRESLSRKTLEGKIRSVAFDMEGDQLAVGLTDGTLLVLRSSNFEEIFRTKERKEVLHEMKYSPDNKYLAVASNDNFVDIYDVSQRYKRVGECSKASSFITHLDWSEDSQYIQINSGAGERLIHKAPSGKHEVNSEVLRAIRWASWTCVLGNEVNGIWEKYTDTNDVNAVDANFEAQICATGDDFGLVKLFRFPTLLKGSKFRRYVGHSAHVTNIRWSNNREYLLSTGGGDHAIFQWRLVKENQKSGASPMTSAYIESNTEASDSNISDVMPVDSDIERERQISYDHGPSRDEVRCLTHEIRKELPPGEKRKLAPTESLRLEFVHGYRGYDCRNNVFYTTRGEIVYHVAALGIVYNRQNHSQRFYNQHTDDILSLTIHPVKDICATGQVGKVPSIHIWDVDTLKTLAILKGQHERGVCAVDFSSDGRNLVSVGMDDNHCIVVWDWRKGEKLATTRGHKDKIFVIKYNPFDNNKVVAVGVRFIRFYTIVGSGFTANRGVFGSVAKLDTNMCAAFGKDVDSCFTGGASGLVYVWQANVLVRTVKAHEGPCFAIHSLEKGFVTGGKDGVICLFDESFERCFKSYSITRKALSEDSHGVLLRDFPSVRAAVLGHQRLLVGTVNGELLEVERDGPLRLLVQGHSVGELWGCAPHPNLLQCATVSDDETLRIWSCKSGEHCMIQAVKLAQPARACAYSPDGSCIAVGFCNGSVTVFKADTFEEVVKQHHRKEEISDLKFSPGDGKYLAVGSHDNMVDLYSTLTQQRVGICSGASSYITHLDWDVRGKLLVVNSGAREQLFFEAPRGTRQTPSRGELDNIQWDSWTGVLGKQVTGIWPPRTDITDINAVSLTKDKSLLATGDDFGYVKIFSYPVEGKFAKHKQYPGHSAHVCNVRWLADDQTLVSCGGADTAVMIWRRQSTGNNHGADEDSDTDSEEEGYDSDVAHEKSIDYKSKAYALSTKERQNLRSNLPTNQTDEDALSSLAAAGKVSVSRQGGKSPRLVESRAQLAAADEGREKKQRSSNIESLELYQIHGYRGFDCRSNLHYLDLQANDIVYHAAGVGIVHHIKTGQQFFYLEHRDDILSLTVNRHPNFKRVIASAEVGEDPTILVWSADSRQTLSTLRGAHRNGVCSLDFSCSGRNLISVGLEDEFFVAVWRWQEGTLIAKSAGSKWRIFQAQFRPDSDSAFVTVGVKHVCFWSLVGNQLTYRRPVLNNTISTKMITFLSVAFGADGTTFTGAMSGDVWVWLDAKLQRIVQKAHSGPVFCLFTTLQDGLIVSGGKEKSDKEKGTVKLWDPEMKKRRVFILAEAADDIVKSVCRVKGSIVVGTKNGVVYEIKEASATSTALVKSHSEGELWGLSVHPTTGRFATASDDGTTCVWSLPGSGSSAPFGSLMHRMHTGPARSVAYSSDGELLAVGLKSGGILLLNSSTLKLLQRRRDRGKSISAINFSPNGLFLAAGSDEGSVDLYAITQPGLPLLGNCRGITAAVIQMDFSADSCRLRVSDANYQQFLFCIPTGEILDSKLYQNGAWSTWTSIVDPQVRGIWPSDEKNADVNCAHVSNSAAAIVTGDDFGLVKLFKFPCLEKNSPFKKFIGHSAHVTNVRFSYDDRYLVSTGGDDCCVFVWKTK